jgi:hypothetical protein
MSSAEQVIRDLLSAAPCVNLVLQLLGANGSAIDVYSWRQVVVRCILMELVLSIACCQPFSNGGYVNVDGEVLNLLYSGYV